MRRSFKNAGTWAHTIHQREHAHAEKAPEHILVGQSATTTSTEAMIPFKMGDLSGTPSLLAEAKTRGMS